MQTGLTWSAHQAPPGVTTVCRLQLRTGTTGGFVDADTNNLSALKMTPHALSLWSNQELQITAVVLHCFLRGGRYALHVLPMTDLRWRVVLA